MKRISIRIAVLTTLLYLQFAHGVTAQPQIDQNISAQSQTKAIIDELDSLQYKSLSLDDLLVCSVMYGWCSDRDALSNKLVKDDVTESNQEIALLYYNAVKKNSWSVYNSLEAMNPDVKKLIPSDVLAHLQAWINGDDPNPIITQKAKSTAWDYIFASSLFSSNKYSEATNIYNAISKDYAGSQNKGIRLFGIVCSVIGSWADTNNLITQKTKKSKDIDVNSDIVPLSDRYNRSEIKMINDLVPQPSYSMSDSLSFSEQIAKADTNYTGNFLSLRGSFTYKENSIEVNYKKENGCISGLIKRNKIPVMHYDGGVLTLFTENQQFKLNKRLENCEELPLKMHIDSAMNNRMCSINFGFGNVDEASVDITDFIHYVSEHSNAVRKELDSSYSFAYIDPSSPLNVVSMKISFNDRRVNRIYSLSYQNGTTFELRDITEDKSKDVVDVSIPESESAKKVSEIKYAFPSEAYLMTINKIIYNQESNESLKTSKIVSQAIHDLYNSDESSLSELVKLGDKYKDAAIREKEYNLLTVSAQFYTRAYEFNNAELIMNKYFSIKEENNVMDLAVNFSDNDELVKEYISSLIQQKKYSKAHAFIRNNLSSMKNDSDRTEYFSTKMLLASLYIYSGSIDKAIEEYNDIITIQEKPADKPEIKAIIDNAVSMKFYLLNYLMRFPEAVAMRNNAAIISQTKDMDLPNWSESDENAVRLKTIIPIMHQSKNYCAPLAIQNAIYYLKGTFVDQKEIARELGTTETGSLTSEIINYFTSHNISVIPCERTPVAVAECIKKGQPVFALLKDPYTGAGHITTIIGVDIKSSVFYLNESGNSLPVSVITIKNLIIMQALCGNILFTIESKKENSILLDQNSLLFKTISYIKETASSSEIDKEKMNRLNTTLDEIEHADTSGMDKYFIILRRLEHIIMRLSNNIPATASEAEFINNLSIPNDNNIDSLKYLFFQRYAHILKLVKKDDVSLKCYNRALALNPKDIFSLLGKAEIYISHNNREKAYETYLESLKLAPYYQSYSNMDTFIPVELAKLTNNSQSAVQYLIKAGGASSDNIKLREETIKLLKAIGDYDTLEYIKQFIVEY